MGNLPSMFGAAGGAGGTGFAGPESAQIVNPIQSGQLAASATGNQQALAQQQALVQALQAQNGIGNQSNIYNQLQGVVSGTGPNPAQAQLAQATGANTANQAALMAGQRGAGSNVGLMARQAAQQGAANQQSAAGQAATLQANQSLNALQSAGNIANTQVANQMGAVNSNTGAQQAQQAALFGAQQGVNNAHVGMQSNINNVNGQLANTQLQGQQATTGGLMNASALTNALARGGKVKRYDDGGAVPDTSTPSFGSDSGAQALSGQKSGGGGGGGLLALLADGGSVGVGSSLATQPSPMGPQSFIGRYMNSSSSEGPSVAATPSFGEDAGAKSLKEGSTAVAKKLTTKTPTGPNTGLQAGEPTSNPMTAPNPSVAPATMVASKGGVAKNPPAKVNALLSPGEGYLPPDDAKAVLRGKENPDKIARRVPGVAKVSGDSLKNDVVPAKLEEGGCVIPRSIMLGKNPAVEAAKFVKRHLAKGGKV